MQCSCGEINSSNAKFCKVCGGSVQKKTIQEKTDLACPNCKENIVPNKKFCTKCGYKLIDQPSDAQPELVGNVEKKSASSEPDQYKQPANIKSSRLDSPVGKNHRKTIIMIGILLVTVIVISVLYWYFKNTKEQLPVSDELSTVNSEVAPDSADNNVPANIEIQTVSDDVLKSYIGKTVKIGDFLGDYFIDSEMKDTKFKLLIAGNDYGDEIILVTNFSGKVFDASHYNYPKNILMDSESACLKDGKPFKGVFVATSSEKLAPPTKIWKISQDGKLIDESVEGLTCAAVFECRPETDDCYSVGHNEKLKETLIMNNNANQSKTQTKAPNTKKVKVQPLPTNSNKNIGNKDAAPSNTAPESEVNGSQKPQSDSKEGSKGLGGFFEKLGESVQKGATVPSCSDAQKAMNQCN